ncbi:MAG: PqqD family protein [Novosphingobium sp.]
MTKPLAKATGSFTETEIDDETVVMSLDSGDFFSLTGTARSIWQLLDHGYHRDGLVAALAEEYGVAGEAIAGEVDAFLSELTAMGLLGAR